MLPRTAHERIEGAKLVSRYPGHRAVSLTARRMMFIISSVQFALATGHVITRVVQLIRAFIGAAGTLDGPSLYLLDQSTPEHVAEEVFYITNVRL